MQQQDSSMNWYNDITHTFMSRGYLQKGQGIDEKIKDIGDLSQSILKIDGFSDKLQAHIKRGFYVSPTPVWKNFHAKSKESSISCVVGDTMIVTIDGCKKARNIEIGDLVLTHKNKFKPVTQVMVTENKGDIWNLQVEDMPELFVTGNHQILTDFGWVRVDDLDESKHCVATNCKDVCTPLHKLVYRGIDKLEKTDLIEDVYDFTVDEDHSFSCAGVVVHNCFGLFIEDSVESILFKSGEVGMQNKIGGGSSGYFGAIRPRGAKIGTEGESNGTISMMEIFQSVSSVISQPNRRGHFSATLDVEHGDFDEFMKIRSEGNAIQDLSFAVSIGNEFMQSVLDGNVENLEKLRKIVQCRYETGFPYIFFRDNANDNTVDVYKDLNMKIHHTNMCVAPNTLITTDKGQLVIKDYENKLVNVWNGKEYSEVLVRKTGTNQKLYRITLNDDSHLDCTDYHRWSIEDDQEEIVIRRTFELKVGDQLEVFNNGLDPDDKVLTVKRIEEVNGLHDTYCFTEKKRSRGTFNGIVTMNCTEVMLPNNAKETFVCNLLGMNLALFDEWKDTDAVEVGIYFMDSMLTDFINKNEGSVFMQPAVDFARRHRAMGMGASGYFDYLQSKMIPFESIQAKGVNGVIFKTIHDQAYKASEKMATEFGKPELLQDDKYKRRHTTLLCVAPNTSSSFIMAQQSQSIEPPMSNYYVKDVAKIRIPVKNKFLQKLLVELGEDKDSVWEDILEHQGSVQHLPFLTDQQKSVFKTFSEISPVEILIQASSRQKFIDQGQSLNLMIPSSIPESDTVYLILKAWKLGLKSLYYQLNISAAQEFNSSSLVRCVSCEG